MTRYEYITTGKGEECGVFEAYDLDGGEVAASIYEGLCVLKLEGSGS